MKQPYGYGIKQMGDMTYDNVTLMTPSLKPGVPVPDGKQVGEVFADGGRLLVVVVDGVVHIYQRGDTSADFVLHSSVDTKNAKQAAVRRSRNYLAREFGHD
ncbi:hypothetical protein SEA_HOPE4EVER_78 [Mycobacterium phage Hope4ever]|nr:hypothetical protein SEA_HOPE4EVER_78 [Mycobacterium phage Hope4ever]